MNLLRRVALLPLLFLLPLAISAQEADLPYHDELYRFIDRIDIKGLTGKPISTEIKPYGRERVLEILRDADTSRMGRRDLAWLNRSRFRIDESYAPERTGVGARWYERGLFNPFYTNKRDLFTHRSEDFSIYVNPTFYWAIGQDRVTPDAGAQKTNSLFRNSNGLQIRGSLVKKIGYFAEVVATQQQFPAYVNSVITTLGAVPGEGNIKPFRDNAWDYFSFRGYLTYSPFKNLRIKFGHDRAFWGQGDQSLVLSDFGPEYLMLNLNWRFWKLEYTNHFTQMVDFIRNKPDALGTYPRKYGAFHMLTFRPNAKLSFSVFESTIFSGQQVNGQRGFELQYLNPVIFFRSVEQYIGSPDNTLLGAMGKANLWNRLQLYGQFLLDDYNVGASKSGSGYWGNKFGYQLGLKYIDVLGVETLDAQVELNSVRPYTYGHYNVSTNYSQYGQYLAHTFGANVRDISLTLNYQPIPALYLYLRVQHVQQGRDGDGRNWGGDIFRSNSTPRPSDYGNTIGQGTEYRLTSVNGRATYQLWRTALYFDLEGYYRKETGGNSLGLLGGLRYNLPWRPTLL